MDFKKMMARFGITGEKEIQAILDTPANAYLNPLWQVSIEYKGKTLTAKPLSHFLHTYLKDYGFEPDEKLDPSPVMVIAINPAAIVKIPMFIKKFPNDNETVTPERARELGMLL